jgi:hypothetical protein
MLECKNIGSNVNHIKKMIVSQYEKWRIDVSCAKFAKAIEFKV